LHVGNFFRQSFEGYDCEFSELFTDGIRGLFKIVLVCVCDVLSVVGNCCEDGYVCHLQRFFDKLCQRWRLSPLVLARTSRTTAPDRSTSCAVQHAAQTVMVNVAGHLLKAEGRKCPEWLGGRPGR